MRAHNRIIPRSIDDLIQVCTRQMIGWVDRLHNNMLCLEFDVKLICLSFKGRWVTSYIPELTACTEIRSQFKTSAAVEMYLNSLSNCCGRLVINSKFYCTVCLICAFRCCVVLSVIKRRPRYYWVTGRSGPWHEASVWAMCLWLSQPVLAADCCCYTGWDARSWSSSLSVSVINAILRW